MMYYVRRVGLSAAIIAVANHLGFAQTGAPVAQQFDKLHFRSIGPAIMSGRISDLAVYEKNPAICYVGTAHGGVWKTTSNGAHVHAAAAGPRAAVDRRRHRVADESRCRLGRHRRSRTIARARRGATASTSRPTAARRSQNVGLRDSKHINRIVIDPSNDDVVLVAATGPLFGPGGDRGVYKTTDGGKTWKRVLFVDDETGANDLVMSYTDPKTIYASTYQRRRTACCVNGGGPGSGIWKSIDGGDTWTRLTSGIPSGPLGRIGLDIYREIGNIVYASIEARDRRVAAAGVARRSGGRRPTAAVAAVDAVAVAGAVAPAPRTPARPDSIARTTAARRGTRSSSTNPRPLYFSQVRIDPNNPDRVYVGGVKM